jgi:hypothetical protein
MFEAMGGLVHENGRRNVAKRRNGRTFPEGNVAKKIKNETASVLSAPKVIFSM